MFSLAGASDGKVVDSQSGIEAALTLMMETMAGGNIVHDLGYLESGLTGSLVQLAICNEVVSWIKYATQDIEINDETLALDLIEETGPDGHFLEADHTHRHYRERYYPDLIERDNYTNWLEKGGKTMAERAAAQVEKILATHTPEPLPEDIADAIHAVVERAEAGHSDAA
jgi:trimethylamine--corrinoid protein Co-methyltransferase